MGIESLGIASVAAITVICYLIGVVCKAFDGIDDKYIPSVVGVSGAVLGVIGFMVKVPEFPATDILTAVAVGIVSGLASTGVNQMIKQLGQ